MRRCLSCLVLAGLMLVGCKKKEPQATAFGELPKPRTQSSGWFRELDMDDPVQGIWGILPIDSTKAKASNAYHIDVDTAGHILHAEWRTEGILRENDKDWATLDVKREKDKETWIFQNLSKIPVMKLVYSLNASGGRSGVKTFKAGSLEEVEESITWSQDGASRPTKCVGTRQGTFLYRYLNDSTYARIEYSSSDEPSNIWRYVQKLGFPRTRMEIIKLTRSDKGITERVDFAQAWVLDSATGLRVATSTLDEKGQMKTDGMTRWSYDAAGNIVEERTQYGIIQKSWARGLLTSRTWRTAEGRLSINREYDAAILRMGYDGKGHQISITVLGEDSLPHFSSVLGAAKILQKFANDSLTETVKIGIAGDTLR